MKLGDTIAVVAKPIVKTIDAVWGTDLEHCSGCSRTQTNLNNAKTLWDFVDAVKDRFRPQEQQQEKNNGNNS